MHNFMVLEKGIHAPCKELDDVEKYKEENQSCPEFHSPEVAALNSLVNTLQTVLCTRACSWSVSHVHRYSPQDLESEGCVEDAIPSQRSSPSWLPSHYVDGPNVGDHASFVDFALYLPTCDYLLKVNLCMWGSWAMTHQQVRFPGLSSPSN